MDAKGRDTLKKAADLIRSGKKNQAQPILVEFLRDEPNNAQGWYLLSHALSDPKRQQYAVLQALRADPTFERARNRLIILQGGTPKPATSAAPAPAFDPVPQPAPKPAPVAKPKPALEQPAPVAKPGSAFFDDQGAEPEATQELRTESTFEEERAPKPKRSFRGVLIVIVLLALVAAAVYFGRDLLPVVLAQPTPTVTEPQAFRTLPPTWTPTPTPQPPTATATSAATSTPMPTVGVTLE